MTRLIRCYSDLAHIHDHRERFEYLQAHSSIGLETFGHERWLNQAFYHSTEWRQARQAVIARDRGCDLGIEGYEIFDQPYIHHMNPLRVQDITAGDPAIIDPEFLICVSLQTHNAIHFGSTATLVEPWKPRKPGDTKLW
jgi:hypothetical protein